MSNDEDLLDEMDRFAKGLVACKLFIRLFRNLLKVRKMTLEKWLPVSTPLSEFVSFLADEVKIKPHLTLLLLHLKSSFLVEYKAKGNLRDALLSIQDLGLEDFLQADLMNQELSGDEVQTADMWFRRIAHLCLQHWLVLRETKEVELEEYGKLSTDIGNFVEVLRTFDIEANDFIGDLLHFGVLVDCTQSGTSCRTATRAAEHFENVPRCVLGNRKVSLSQMCTPASGSWKTSLSC